MKIVSTIVLVIAFLFAAFLALVNIKNGSDMAEIESSGMGGVLSMVGDLPSSGNWFAGAGVSIGLVFAAIFGIVATFSKSKKIGLIGAGAVGLFALLAIILTPSVDGGPTSGANPKTVAIIVGVISLAGAAVLGLIANKREA